MKYYSLKMSLDLMRILQIKPEKNLCFIEAYPVLHEGKVNICVRTARDAENWDYIREITYLMHHPDFLNERRENDYLNLYFKLPDHVKHIWGDVLLRQMTLIDSGFTFLERSIGDIK